MVGNKNLTPNSRLEHVASGACNFTTLHQRTDDNGVLAPCQPTQLHLNLRSCSFHRRKENAALMTFLAGGSELSSLSLPTPP